MYNYKNEKKNLHALLDRHREFMSDEIGKYRRANKQVELALVSSVNSSSVSHAVKAPNIISLSLMEKIYESLESSNLKKAKR